MEPLIQFFNEATAALNRASGLSVAFSKAAFGLVSLAAETNVVTRVRTAAPKSASDVKRLREAGIRLYNIAKRGPNNDINTVKLQWIACEAMVGGNGVEASGENLELRLLDAMRCFSRTGLLLSGLGEVDLAKETLTKCVQLIENDPFTQIFRVFGSSQEAHDSGAAYFAALSSLCTLHFDAALADGLECEKRAQRLGDVLSLLKLNMPFFSRMHSAAQKVVRSILEKNICSMDLRESLQFQKWLFEEYEDSSASTQQNILVGARLAYSLAKAGDTNGAIAVLERVNGRVEPATKISAKQVFLDLANCAVATAKLHDELKISSLVPSSLTAVGIETKRHLDESTTRLKDEALQAFRNCIDNESLFSIGDNYEGLNLAMDCANDLCEIVESFEKTFGLILMQPARNREVDRAVLLYILNSDERCCLRWASSETGQSLVAQFAKTSTPDAFTQLGQALWNNVCKCQVNNDWHLVLQFSIFLSSVSDGNPDMAARALQAQALATLHVSLPDKDGCITREIDVLRAASENAHRAQSLATTTELKMSAAITEMKCLARSTVIDKELTTTSRLVDRANALLTAEIATASSLQEVAFDASSVDATKVAIRILETARDHLILRTGKPLDNARLQSVLKQLILERLRISQLSEASNDVSSYFTSWEELGNAIDCKELEPFTNWIHDVFVERARLDSSEGNLSLEKALAVASVLEVAARVAPLKAENDRILAAAAGTLVDSCMQALHVGLDPGSTEHLLVPFAAERASTMLTKISARLKLEEPRIGIAMIFASMFMAATVPDADDAVADHIVAICDNGEYAFPMKRGLEYASKVAQKLHFPRTARHLLVRVVQYELTAQSPDYNRVVRRCLTKLLASSTDSEEVAEWAGQIANICAVADLAPNTLERSAVVLWNKQHLTDDPSLLSMAISWLALACKNDECVASRRLSDLEAMQLLATHSARPHDCPKLQADTADRSPLVASPEEPLQSNVVKVAPEQLCDGEGALTEDEADAVRTGS